MPPRDNRWKKFIEARVRRKHRVNQVQKVRLPDLKYFENYKEDRKKPWRPNRDLEIHAFISLQHLIIARFGRELESVNDGIFEGLRTSEDDVECDLEMLWEAQEAIHLYCELAFVPLFPVRRFDMTEIC